MCKTAEELEEFRILKKGINKKKLQKLLISLAKSEETLKPVASCPRANF